MRISRCAESDAPEILPGQPDAPPLIPPDIAIGEAIETEGESQKEDRHYDQGRP